MNDTLERAVHAMASSHYAEAEELSRRVLEADETNAEAYRTLGGVLLAQKKITEAIACLEAAYALAEADHETGELLAQAYREARMPREAAELDKQRLRYFPSDAAIMQRVVAYYQEIGSFEDRIRGIQAFIKTHFPSGRPTTQRVMFGMSFSIYSPCRVHDFLLSRALIMRGAEIIPITCSKAQEGECNVFGGIWGGMTGDSEHDRKQSEENCRVCMASDRMLWNEWSGLEPVALSRFITPERRAAIKAAAAGLDLTDYLSLSIDGMPVGRWASDVIRNNFMVGDDALVPDLEGQIRHFIANMLLTIEGSSAAIEEIRPDVIVSNDSYYYQWAILEELARRRGIPFYSHWQGGRKMGWCYAFGEPSMELNVSRCWPAFNARTLEAHEERIVDDFLAARPTGSTMTLNTADPAQNSDTRASEELDLSKPSVLLAANVIWDLAALNREIQFDDMIDWTCRTIEFFAARPDWQLIIKPHPGELNKSLPATRQLLSDEIAKRIPVLPKNVIVCSPLTSLSVYDLLPRVRFGLVFTSTVGLEMACRGMAVVTAGRSLYHSKGFTIDTETPQEYFAAIDALMSQDASAAIDDARAEMARKFLYLYLFRYYASLNLFDHSFTDHPTLLMHDAQELLPGANDVLDYVCDAIMTHRPIVRETELAPLGRTLRGLYQFTREETLAAARLVLDGYQGDIHEEILKDEAGMQTVRLAGSLYRAPKGVFKSGELSWIYQEVSRPSPENPHAYENDFLRIEKDDVVIDAGAFAGFFTRRALAQRARRVYAFEPMASIASALQETFRTEAEEGKVIVVPAALTNFTGSAGFSDNAQFICEAHLAPDGAYTVVTTTLDDFVTVQNIERIDFIKMDIEGEEMNAVEGALQTINRFRPKMAIAVYHEYENAVRVQDIILAQCPGYEVELGGRFVYALPHRPYMVYARFNVGSRSASAKDTPPSQM